MCMQIDITDNLRLEKHESQLLHEKTTFLDELV